MSHIYDNVSNYDHHMLICAIIPPNFFLFCSQKMSNQLSMQVMTEMIKQMAKECRSMDTALHEAAYAGDHEQLKELLYEREHRKHINSKNRLGCTPLRLAASGNVILLFLIF